MNNVLASGEVSNLFARDELEDITQDLIPALKRQHPRRSPTPENLYDFFLSRVRNNLHVVLCFSPVGEKFRTRALKVRPTCSVEVESVERNLTFDLNSSQA